MWLGKLTVKLQIKQILIRVEGSKSEEFTNFRILVSQNEDIILRTNVLLSCTDLNKFSYEASI